MPYKIEILDPVHARACNPATWDEVKRALAFDAEFWKKERTPTGYTRKVRKNYIAHLTLSDPQRHFPTGLVPRVVQSIQDVKNEKPIVTQLYNITMDHIAPNVPGITFREDQLRLIQAVIDKKRGLLQAPARTGKTVIAAGIISAFPKARILFLCHTKGLISQTNTEFRGFGFNTTLFTGEEKSLEGRIVIATHQSLVKLNPEIYCDMFDIIIVDETHHVTDLDGNYGKILRNSLAEYRIGLTATPYRDNKKNLLTLEGLMGPKIEEVTQQEARDLNLLAKPKVTFLKTPITTLPDGNKTSYQTSYTLGIVENRARNRMIVLEADKYMEEKSTVLILVKRVAHGFNIRRMFDLLRPDRKVIFICAGLDSETRAIMKNKSLLTTAEQDRLLALRKEVDVISSKREEYRLALNKGEIQCVIATNIWNEGINIPNLNVVMNVGAGKSEITTIQAASRSLTKAPGKEYGIIVDIFDNFHTTFIAQFGERICLYIDQGWL